MNVAEALRTGARRLRAGGSRSPRLDAELFLADALGVDRVGLFKSPEREFSAAEAERFAGFVQRREALEPVAYIRGWRAFRTIDLEVTAAVLIPRPDTETLVEVALELLAEAIDGGERQPLVLDVGTGSGCVALALAAENSSIKVVAVDVDDEALEVARRNAVRLGLMGRVDLVGGDLFDGLPEAWSFDLIVSNPPYIPDAEYESLEPGVRDYEPRLALHGGDDGLDVYRRLIPAAGARLRPGGFLAVEVGRGEADGVRALFAAAEAYGPARARPDLEGIPRVVFAPRVHADAGG